MTATIWNAATGARLETREAQAEQIVISMDGRKFVWVLSTDPYLIQVWDVPSGDVKTIEYQRSDGNMFFYLSHSGRYLLASSPSSPIFPVWDLAKSSADTNQAFHHHTIACDRGGHGFVFVTDTMFALYVGPTIYVEDIDGTQGLSQSRRNVFRCRMCREANACKHSITT